MSKGHSLGTIRWHRAVFRALSTQGIDDTDMAAGDGDEEGIVALPVETAHKVNACSVTEAPWHL